MSEDPANPWLSEQEDVMERSYDRPIGISLLALYLIVSGLFMFGLQVIASNQQSSIADIFGAPRMLVTVSIVGLGLLGVASGIGIRMGKRWGWWLALVYFAYAALRNGNAIVTVPGLADAFGVSADKTTASILKYVVRLLFDIGLLVYLTREKAIVYCNATQVNKLKAVGIAFSLSLAVFVIAGLTY